MANMLFANNCNTTLNGGITAVATSMVVTSAAGFPAPTGSQYFYCTLADAATQTTIEIVKVTAVSGTTFTIVRGQDGTTGTIFASGAVVSLRLVAASLNDFPKLDEANTFTGANAYGTPASIVLTNASGTASININGTVGATTASTGAFTTLSASSTVSGTGFSTYLASPPAIGGTAAAAGKFTTLAATGVFTASSGTAALPSIVTLSGSTSGLYSSTANVLGVAISATSIGTFTSTGLNGMAVGATTASTGAFTTLSASSTVSGTGFSTYLASPPAIGGTAAAAVTGSNLMSSGGVWAKGLYAGTTYTDGLVIDYVSPTARFSAGTSDGFAWYNGGVGTTTLMTLSSTGAIGTATWNGATVGVAYGGTGLTSFTSNGIIYASSSSVLANSSALTFDGTNFATTGYASATSFRPTSSTVPTNGLYLSAANTLGWATNSTAQASLDANGNLSSKAFVQTSTTLYGMTLATLAPAFNFDAATCAVTVTSGNSISFSSSFSGVIMVTDTGYSGCTAVLICGGGGTLVLGNSTTTQYFTNSSIAGDYRFYSTGGAYQLFASARTTTFKIISFRTQNTT